MTVQTLDLDSPLVKVMDFLDQQSRKPSASLEEKKSREEAKKLRRLVFEYIGNMADPSDSLQNKLQSNSGYEDDVVKYLVGSLRTDSRRQMPISSTRDLTQSLKVIREVSDLASIDHTARSLTSDAISPMPSGMRSGSQSLVDGTSFFGRSASHEARKASKMSKMLPDYRVPSIGSRTAETLGAQDISMEDLDKDAPENTAGKANPASVLQESAGRVESKSIPKEPYSTARMGTGKCHINGDVTFKRIIERRRKDSSNLDSKPAEIDPFLPDAWDKIGMDPFLDFICEDSLLANMKWPLVVVVQHAAETLGLDFLLRRNDGHKKLLEYAMEVEEGYSDKAYHCKLHAADVTNRLVSILTSIGISDDNEWLALAALVAGMIHDYQHPQLTNQYLVVQVPAESPHPPRQLLHHSGGWIRDRPCAALRFRKTTYPSSSMTRPWSRTSVCGRR